VAAESQQAPPDKETQALIKAIEVTLGIFEVRGVNVGGKAWTWANTYLQELRDAGAALECEILLRAGCKKIALAAVIKGAILIGRVPLAQRETFGEPKRLDQLVHQFETTALLFDGMSRTDLGLFTEWPFEHWMPSPQKMATQLRAYQTASHSIPALLKAANIRSVEDIERHLLTAYVKSKTGAWHDREVSALIQAATQRDLDEGTHRKWRGRNFDELHLPGKLVWQVAELIEARQDKTA
jgi:hypothetical protein